MEATIEGPRINAVGDSTIVLTAVAEGATSFEWRFNDVTINRVFFIEDADGNRDTLAIVSEDSKQLTLIATGNFPDRRTITAAGINVVGTGRFSPNQVFEFNPWRVPDMPIVTVSNNECPDPFVWADAEGKQAASFEWFFDGEPIGEALDTNLFAIHNNGRRLSLRANGELSARGVNQIGKGQTSGAVEAIWTMCNVLEIANHTYTVTGFDWSFGRTDFVWQNQVIEPAKDGDLVIEDVFLARNWHPEGFAEMLDLGMVPAGSSYTITIHRDSVGNYYIPYGVNVGIPGLIQTWIHVDSTNVETGTTYYRYNAPHAGLRLYLEVAYDDDDNPIYFRIPPDEIICVTPPGGECDWRIAKAALTIFRGTPTTVMSTSGYHSMLYHIFTIENPSSSGAPSRKRIDQVNWRPAPVRNLHEIPSSSAVQVQHSK
jgi:hypothetical protein